ncbi:hypothetical protein, partial [Salmonella enterica]|uniref:hypothetical protein n=1 Tax=Salmonella enterica TaxID=28901 RepID=UPI001195957B
ASAYGGLQYGYVTISETIDPRDWQPGITEGSILEETKNEIASAITEHESDSSHVILLHDAGGNRQATIAALPQIIDYFRNQGYRFARVGELIAKDRSQVMPRPSGEELRLAHIEGGGLDAKARFRQVLGVLFLSAIFMTAATRR